MSQYGHLDMYKWSMPSGKFNVYEVAGNREAMDKLIERAVLREVSEFVWYLDRPHYPMDPDVKADLEKLLGADYEERYEKAIRTDTFAVSEVGKDGSIYFQPEGHEEGERFETWAKAAHHYGVGKYEDAYHGQYQYYLLSGPLASDLLGSGEIIGHLFGLDIWARKTLVEMQDDLALQNVAAGRKILVGQDNHGNELFHL